MTRIHAGWNYNDFTLGDPLIDCFLKSLVGRSEVDGIVSWDGSIEEVQSSPIDEPIFLKYPFRQLVVVIRICPGVTDENVHDFLAFLSCVNTKLKLGVKQSKP